MAVSEITVERQQIRYTTSLETLSCGSCGIPFAIPLDMHRKVKDSGDSFWCPNGHQISYHRSEADNLRDKLAREQSARKRAEAAEVHQRDQRVAAERSAAAYKGRVTRLKNRAAAGVCPCCNRHFENVERHMSTKHPDFRDSE
jgi:hypothetical protein